MTDYVNIVSSSDEDTSSVHLFGVDEHYDIQEEVVKMRGKEPVKSSKRHLILVNMRTCNLQGLPMQGNVTATINDYLQCTIPANSHESVGQP